MLVYGPAEGQSYFFCHGIKFLHTEGADKRARHVAGGEGLDKAPAEVVDVVSGCSSAGLDLCLTFKGSYS